MLPVLNSMGENLKRACSAAYPSMLSSEQQHICKVVDVGNHMIVIVRTAKKMMPMVMMIK